MVYLILFLFSSSCLELPYEYASSLTVSLLPYALAYASSLPKDEPRVLGALNVRLKRLSMLDALFLTVLLLRHFVCLLRLPLRVYLMLRVLAYNEGSSEALCGL